MCTNRYVWICLYFRPNQSVSNLLERSIGSIAIFGTCYLSYGSVFLFRIDKGFLLIYNLDDIKKQIQELENKKLHITDPNQLEELKKQTSELREQENTINRKLALAKQELEIARQQAEIEAKRNLESKTASQFNRAYGSSGQIRVTSKEELDLAISKHEELTQAIEKLKEEQYAYAEAHGDNAKKVQKYRDEIAELEEELAKVDARGVEMANTLQQDADALTSTDESTQQLKSSVEDSIDAWQKATGYQEEAAEQIQATEEEIEEETDEIEDLDKTLDSLGKANETQEEEDWFGFWWYEYRGFNKPLKISIRRK